MPAIPANTRRSLLSRLRDWQDQRSWQEFFDTYWKLIYRAASQAGLNDATAQDVVQEVIIAVARQMPDFHYDPAVGSFKHWLLSVTRHKIHDQLRRQYRQPRPATAAAPAELPVPAADTLAQTWEAEWEAAVMARALACTKRKVDARQFQIFDCHVVKGWPVRTVAQTLHVSENQVYLAKSRVGALVRREIQRLRQQLI